MWSKNKNLTEKSINFLLNILIIVFGIILLISIYTSVQTKVLGNNYTNFFGYSIFEVETGSMTGTIDAGDWIIVRLTQKVKLNDIVTYELNGEYITHRIIEVYQGSYVTKGDANSAKDEPIKQNQIIGKVVKVVANFGLFRKILFNSSVLITFIVTVFLFNLAFKKSKIKAIKFNMENINYLPLNNLIKKINMYLDNFKKFIDRLLLSINNKPKPKEVDKELLYKNFSFEIDDRFKKPVKKVENNEADDEELEKTIFYRAVPVDANEVDDKYKDSLKPTIDEELKVDNDEDMEDELDKTSLYRVIPVDVEELDNTFLEIAQNEVKETSKNEKIKKEEKIEQPKSVEVEEENLTKINFDLLKNRKGKNIIDTAMLIQKDELSELSNILINGRFDKPTIKDLFIKTYIDVRYYNYYDDKNVEHYGKGLNTRMAKIIKEFTDKLIHDYHGKDKKYNDIVSLYSNTFILINNLEHANESISDLKAKKEFYKKEIIKYNKDLDNLKIEDLIDQVMKIQKSYIDTLEYFMKSLDTNMFNLCINKLNNKKDMYGLEIKHNISFSKVYSDYIIDKTYTEGIVAEDKITILLTLLSVQLIKDMITSAFNKKYILYIPRSLYTKEKKLERLLNIIDDRHAKNNVIILLTIEDLLSNKQILKKVRKMGYKFALIFNNDTVVEEKDKGNIYIADYIFIDKKNVNISKIRSFIPEELLKSVIDEVITDKVGDFGSE